MPNGFHGSKYDWFKMVMPLDRVDEVIDRFALSYGAETRRNERGWPNRVLLWAADLDRRIEIVLAEDREPAYRINVAAWKDEAALRYWRSETIEDRMDSARLSERLAELLEVARQEVFSWELGDLVAEPL